MIYQPNESPAMRPAAALAPIVKPGSGKAPLHYHPPCGPGAVAEGKGYGCGREKGGSEIEHGGGSKTRFLPTFCYRFLPGRNFFFLCGSVLQAARHRSVSSHRYLGSSGLWIIIRPHTQCLRLPYRITPSLFPNNKIPWFQLGRGLLATRPTFPACFATMSSLGTKEERFIWDVDVIAGPEQPSYTLSKSHLVIQ